MIKVKFIHIECFFIFFKSHFLLKNNWSLISVDRSFSSDPEPQPLQMDNNHQKLVGVSQQRFEWIRGGSSQLWSPSPGP